MTASDRFILALFPPPAGREDRLRSLATTAGFDWQAVEDRSVAWGLAPLVHYRLVEAKLLDRAPAGVIGRLSEIRRYTAVRNALFDRELHRIAAALERTAIPVIALKGADLMRTVYPHPALRISLDIDLLVRREDVDRAEASLASIGYAPGISMERDWYDDNLHHGVPWQNAGQAAAVVELHWGLVRRTDPFEVDLPLLWSRARALPSGRGGPGRLALLRLSPEDCIEYLAIHFFRHLTTPDGAFRSLADLVLLLDSPDGRVLAWDRLRAEAVSRGTALPLALVLRLIDETWPERGLGGIAHRFEADLADPRLPARADRLVRDLFRLPPAQPPAIVSGFTRLGQEPGVGGKLKFLTAGLFPRREHMNRDLSDGQSRLPLLLRYPALAFNYARELGRIGPRAALAAYRLGSVRREMEKKLAGRS